MIGTCKPTPARAPRAILGALACVGAFGCGDDTTTEPHTHRRTTPTNQPPIAALSVSPTLGVAPLLVTLDASASSDPDQTTPLSVRWDFDADGTFDTEFATNPVQNHRYTEPGSYHAIVEVQDDQGLTATTTNGSAIIVSDPTAPYADLDADSNRNGLIDDADDALEESFNNAQGAVLLANLDDDDADGERDALDEIVNGDGDLDDLAQLVVRKTHGVTSHHSMQLTVAPAAAATQVRLFAKTATGWSVLYQPNDNAITLDLAELALHDLEVRAEARTTRSPTWDGQVTLTLTLMENDTTVDTDVVALRVAPVLFPDNTRPTDILYVMRIDHSYDSNLPFYDAMVANLPTGVTIYSVAGADYNDDRWLQDNMQPGYQLLPATATPKILRTYLETARGRDLAPLLPDELLGPELGYVYPCAGNAPCDGNKLDYGGNIEVAPPYSVAGIEHPFGRLVIGGGDVGTLYGTASNKTHMSPPQHRWLDSQGPQSPALELSTEWLVVGHVDEYFLFVPDYNPSATRPWKVVIASPDLARNLLETLMRNGSGDAAIFSGRSVETTVADVLADQAFLSFNELAQARIDTARDLLAAELGLTDDDFVEVPVLYEEYNDGWSASELAVAYNPGLTNLVPVRDVFFVPDPEGPDDGNGDVWKQATTQALSPLGVTLVYVDVFESYHVMMGEAHCGTNLENQPYATSWWQVE